MLSAVVRRVYSRPLRRGFGVAIGLLVVSTSFATMAPRAAAAAPAPTTAQSPSATTDSRNQQFWSNLASGLINGRRPSTPPMAAALPASNKPAPTEVPSLRTAYSRTFDNHDGMFSAEVHASPINYQPSPGAAWQPIDLSFTRVAGSSRLSASQTLTPVEVGSPDDPKGFFEFRTGSAKVRLHLAPNATPGTAGSKPIADPGMANVLGLLPNVDLRVIDGANGAATFLILHSKPTVPTFSFVLDAGSLTPVLQSDGSIDLDDATGSSVATMPKPYAVDSSSDPSGGTGQVTDKVSYSLISQGAQTLLGVSVDPSWLASATYPVYVDPTFAGPTQTTDNFVSSAFPNTAFPVYTSPDDPSHKELWLGTNPANKANVNNVYVDFNVAGLANTTIDSASLRVFPYKEYYPAPRATTTWVGAVNGPWQSDSLTWNNQPGVSSYVASAGLVQGQWGAFDVTKTVQGWAANPAANYGLMLSERGQNSTYWKRLISSEDASGDGPQLLVTYHVPTATVAGPTGGAWTGSRKLAWAYADAAGLTEHKISVDVSTNPGFTSFVAQSGALSSSSTSWTVPATVSLTDGTLYYWRVSVYNGKSWSAPAVGSFTWDASKPAWSGSVFSAPAAKTDQPGSSYAYAWNAATDLSGIAGYQLTEQVASIKSPNVCGSDWAARATYSGTATTYPAASIPAGKCDRLKLQAIDRAGNSSAAVYSAAILVDATAPAVPSFTSNASSVGAYQAGNTIYFLPSKKATVKLKVAATDPESGIASASFGALSAPSGWTYTPGALTGAAPSRNLTWSATAMTTTLTLTVTNGAGLTSAPATITLAPDTTAPAGEFATPHQGTTTLQAGTTYPLAWSEADAGSGIASRSLVRQRAQVVIPGSCAGLAWAADGTASAGASPLNVTGLASGFCYRWVLTLTDNLGNAAAYTSGSVLVDTATPNLPIVTASGAGYQPAPGGWVYVNGNSSGSVTLAATPQGTSASGLACVEFSNLTPASGWTAAQTLPYCAPTSPYSLSLGYVPAVTSATIDVSSKNGAGTNSDPATITLAPDRDAPTGQFATSAAGTTILQSSTAYGVAWTEADSGSGVGSRSIIRQRGTIVAPGSCAGVTFTDDAPASSSASPISVTGLSSGYCYRWVLSLTDNVGNAASYTSGSVLVDTSAPAAPTISSTTPAGTYRLGDTIFFGPGSGSITLTSSGVDPESDITSSSFGSISGASGWTYTPATVAGNPASINLGWSDSATAAVVSVTTTDNVGLVSDPATITLAPDRDAPTGQFATPAAGATILQSSTAYGVAWTEADSGSGVATRSIVRQRGTIVAPGSCAGVTFADDAAASSSASPTSVTGLSSGYCYRWILSLTDNVGNAASYTSGSVLVDTSTPAAPTIGATTPAGTYRLGDTIFFGPGSGSITLTSSGVDPESDIASSSFGAISGASGWTYTPATIPGNPASIDLAWSDSATAAVVSVTTTDHVNLTSDPATITLAPDRDAPTGQFATPAAGATILQSSTAYGVAWTEADSGSGVATRSIVRQRGTIVAPGSCAGVTFADDAAASNSASPISVTGLASGYCYRWVLSLTDNVGNAASYTSGSVLVDTTSASAPDVVVTSALGVYQAGPDAPVYFNPNGSGTITLSASMSVLPASGIGSITFGNLSAADGWTATPELPAVHTSAPYVESLAFGPASGSATIDVTARSGAGGDSPTRTVSLVADPLPPSADFAAPVAGTTILGPGQPFSVDWSETDGSGTGGPGIAARTLQRRSAAPIDGACPGAFDPSWSADGPIDTAPVSGKPVSLDTDRCYDWQLTLVDHVGNAGTQVSGSVLVASVTQPAPDVTAAGPGVYQAGPNGTVFVSPDASATLTATSKSTSISSVTFGALAGAAGWTSTPVLPATVTASPYSEQVTASAGASSTEIDITANSGSASSPARQISIVVDANAPTVDFGSPAEGSLSLQAGTSFVVSWTEADAGSGVASRTVLQRRAPAAAGQCPASDDSSWHQDRPADAGFVSGKTVTGLASGYCYDWLVTITDRVGSTAAYASGAVLVDSAVWAAPDVTISGSGLYQPAPDGPVHFKPGSSGTASVSASISTPASGLNGVTFGNLTASGWTADPALPAVETASPFGISLHHDATAASGTIDVFGRNGTGGASQVQTINLVADDSGPAATFATPAPGTTTVNVGGGGDSGNVDNSNVYLSWTEADSGSGLAGYSLQRQVAQIVTPGSCDGVSWSNSGAPEASTQPPDRVNESQHLSQSGCYQWVLTITDRVGNSSSLTSGSVLVDIDPPQAVFSSPKTGTTVVSTQANYSVTWSETDSATGVAWRTLQREKTSLGTDGTCNDSGWAPDGAPVTDPSPNSNSDLTMSSCYRWDLWLTDGAQNQNRVTSGVLAVSPIKLDYPLDGWTLFSTETLQASVADGTTASSLDFLVDGKVVGSATSTPYQVTLDTTTIPDGLHTLVGRAVLPDGTIDSPEMKVTVGNGFDAIDRVNADWKDGRLSASDYALYATYAHGAPDQNPARYSSTTPNPQDAPMPVLPSSGVTSDVTAQINAFLDMPLRYQILNQWVADLPQPHLGLYGAPATAPANCVMPGVTFTNSPALTVDHYHDDNLLPIPTWMEYTNICELSTAHFNVLYLADTVSSSSVPAWTDASAVFFDDSTQSYVWTDGKSDGLPSVVSIQTAILEQAYSFYTAPMNHADQPIPPSSGVSDGGLGFSAPSMTWVNICDTGPVTEQPILPGGLFPRILTLESQLIPSTFSTPEHEFFHEVQGQYITGTELTGWEESTAEWAATRFMATHTEYDPGLPTGFSTDPAAFSNQLARPDRSTYVYLQDPTGPADEIPDDHNDYSNPAGNGGYERMLFPEYVTEHFRADFVLKVFQLQYLGQQTGVTGPYTMSVDQAVTAVLGPETVPIFQGFAVASYLIGASAASVQSLSGDGILSHHEYSYTYHDIGQLQTLLGSLSSHSNPLADPSRLVGPSFVDRFVYEMDSYGLTVSSEVVTSGGHVGTTPKTPDPIDGGGTVSLPHLGVQYVQIDTDQTGSVKVSLDGDTGFAVQVVSGNYGNPSGSAPPETGNICSVSAPLQSGTGHASVDISADPTTCPTITLVITNSSGTSGKGTWKATWLGTATGEVQGKVYDRSSGAAIAGAEVAEVNNAQVSTTSTRSGSYDLSGLAAPSVTLEASAPGYQPETVSVPIESIGASTYDFSLARTVTSYQSLSVVPIDARSATDSLPPPAEQTTPEVVASLGGDTVIGGTYTTPSGVSQGYLARVTEGGKYRWSVAIPNAQSVGAVDAAGGVVYMAAHDSSESFVAAFDAATGSQRWLTSFTATYTHAYVAAIPGGGAYFGATFDRGGYTGGFLEQLGASGDYLNNIDPGGSAIGIDGAYTGPDGSLYAGIRTSSGTTIEHYANGVIDPAFSVAVPAGGLWTFDHSSGSSYVAGRSGDGDTVAKYDVTGLRLWWHPTSVVALVGSSSIAAMTADSGSLYFAWKGQATYHGTQTRPTVALTVAGGAEGYLEGTYESLTDTSEAAFGGYDFSIAGLSVSNGRASIVGTTDPSVFASTWDSQGGQWPSLESVRLYGFLAPFSVYGNNGVLVAGKSQTLPSQGNFGGSIGLDASGNRYVSIAGDSVGRTSTLVKYAPDGSTIWSIDRPTWVDNVTVVGSGPHAGVYVAGVTNYMYAMDVASIATYSLDGQLGWSQDPMAAVESGTSSAISVFLAVRPNDGSVYFAGDYGTSMLDPRGAGLGVYIGLAGPSGVTGRDGFETVGSGSAGVAGGEVQSTPDGSQFYVHQGYSLVRYNQDLSLDTSFSVGMDLSSGAFGFTVDQQGQLYVVALDTSYTGAVSSDGYSIAQYKVSKYSASGGCLWNVYPHWSSSYYLGDGLQIAVAAGKLYVVGPGGGSAVVDVWNADTGAALDEEVIASDGWWTSMAANDSGQVAIATSTFLVPYQWTAP